MERQPLLVNQKNFIVKGMATLPKLIYRFNTIPIKIQPGVL